MKAYLCRKHEATQISTLANHLAASLGGTLPAAIAQVLCPGGTELAGLQRLWAAEITCKVCGGGASNMPVMFVGAMSP